MTSNPLRSIEPIPAVFFGGAGLSLPAADLSTTNPFQKHEHAELRETGMKYQAKKRCLTARTTRRILHLNY